MGAAPQGKAPASAPVFRPGADQNRAMRSVSSL